MSKISTIDVENDENSGNFDNNRLHKNDKEHYANQNAGIGMLECSLLDKLDTSRLFSSLLPKRICLYGNVKMKISIIAIGKSKSDI